jgi:hypothetical protein
MMPICETTGYRLLLKMSRCAWGFSRKQKNLADLKNLLDNKAQAMDVMMLIHGQLHPNLQIAYGLKLKQ